jgi:hypothetical protein
MSLFDEIRRQYKDPSRKSVNVVLQSVKKALQHKNCHEKHFVYPSLKENSQRRVALDSFCIKPNDKVIHQKMGVSCDPTTALIVTGDAQMGARPTEALNVDRDDMALFRRTDAMMKTEMAGDYLKWCEDYPDWSDLKGADLMNLYRFGEPVLICPCCNRKYSFLQMCADCDMEWSQVRDAVFDAQADELDLLQDIIQTQNFQCISCENEKLQFQSILAEVMYHDRLNSSVDVVDGHAGWVYDVDKILKLSLKAEREAKRKREENVVPACAVNNRIMAARAKRARVNAGSDNMELD